MRYAPIDSMKRKYIGKHWSEVSLRGFTALMSAFTGPSQMVSFKPVKKMTGLEEFEYWFTDDPDKFERLLRYPKIKLYMERKGGEMRRIKALGGFEAVAKKEPLTT